MVTQMMNYQNLGQLRFPCSPREVLFKKLKWVVVVRYLLLEKNKVMPLFST